MKLILIILFFITQATGSHALFSQSICSENEIESVNDAKRTSENNLVHSTAVTKLTDEGIEVTAFYYENRILKISTSNSASVSEQIFFNSDYQMVYYERSGFAGSKEFFDIYYFRGNTLFCRENGLNGEKVKFSKKAGKKILETVEKYLLEVQ